MKVVVVGRWGKRFDEVEVEVRLENDYAYADLVSALPAAAAAAEKASPGGIFEGMQLVGERSTWIVQGAGANGRAWSYEVEAVSEEEAGFQGAVAALEATHAGHPSSLEPFMEGLRRQRIVSATPQAVDRPGP